MSAGASDRGIQFEEGDGMCVNLMLEKEYNNANEKAKAQEVAIVLFT